MSASTLPAPLRSRQGADPGTTAMFSLREVTKRFGPTTALSAVTITVPPAAILSIAGENGSGKSTLVKVLAGILQPDAGSVVVDGQPVTFGSPRHALDRGIAIVSQEPTFVPELSVAENLLLAGLRRELSRTHRARMTAEALPLLEAVGLDVDPSRRYRTLSQGQREQAEIARALATRPRLLILDEVTTRLTDPERLFTLIERLRDQDGLSTILITHRLREIRRVADHAVVLRDGQVAGELGRGELTDKRLSSMMVGRELSDFFSKPSIEVGEVALRVSGVVTRRGRPPASLEVRRGEILGLAGLDGAGRTSLLETVAGRRPPVTGSVECDGRTVRPGSVDHALRAGITLVPEDRKRQGIVPALSVARNVSLGRAPMLGVARRRDERRIAARLVDDLGIRTASLDAPIRTLSGGNQQKVVIGRCLARSPRVLLLDEPTRGIDIAAKHDAYRLIGAAAAEGAACLLASSELPELLGLCDRILVLHEGAVVGELTRSEATEERIALLSAGGGAPRGDG